MVFPPELLNPYPDNIISADSFRPKLVFELLAADQPDRNMHPDPDSKFWKWTDDINIENNNDNDHNNNKKSIRFFPL